MKLRNILINSLTYFLYVFGACILARLVESMLVSFIGKLIVQFSYPAWVIFCVIFFSVAPPVLLSRLSYSEGYREGVCSIPETVVGCLPALVLHTLLSMLFKFHAFVAGAVRFTAGLVWNGTTVTADKLVNDTPYWFFLVIFFSYWVLYIATITISKYLGAQKRIINRADLRRNEVADAPEA